MVHLLYFNNFGKSSPFSSVDPLRVHMGSWHSSLVLRYTADLKLDAFHAVAIVVLILAIKPRFIRIKTDLDLCELLQDQLF